jgi:hypothetical protein
MSNETERLLVQLSFFCQSGQTGNDNTRDALTLLGKRYAGIEMANRRAHVTYFLRGKASEDQSVVFGALRAYLSPEYLGRFVVQNGI